ncbi:hypothetical protein [Anaeromicropila herbilytica]|uniref:GLUG domain-containing protein n=1 Tax=Anaeromicropila herbilytica TaxID=2785025 RepID=A0A7R7ELN3_9FIRM|nr:hypothetical protein [Anaeromicropila herbilytica]BCN30860.1 hypothetical protein bsdtb5_21550 [Anaeromicropila herbilytica]
MRFKNIKSSNSKYHLNIYIRENRLINRIFKLTMSILLIIFLTSNFKLMLYKNVNAEKNVWDGSIATSFAKGDGSDNNPYEISNGSQLALAAKYINDNVSNYACAHYILTNNIYLNYTNNWKEWDKIEPKNTWISIGGKTRFSGVFDGNGFVIYGLYNKVQKVGKNYKHGLFKNIYNASIMNLGVEKSFIIGSKNNDAYGIVDFLWYGVIQNCHFSGQLIGEHCSVSGITILNKCGIVKNCYNEGTIITGNSCRGGGIAGSNTGTIDNCYNKAKISTKSKGFAIGGIVGMNGVDSISDKTMKFKNSKLGVVKNCINRGNISCVKASSIGGIVGVNNNDGTIKNCINYNKITMKSNCSVIGGIIGDTADGNVLNSENKGAINCGNKCVYIGGVSGTIGSGSIYMCKNSGTLKIDDKCQDIGGICGGPGDFNYSVSNKIYNNCNSGKITCGKSCDDIGGIAGEFNGTSYNCSNKGNINVAKDSEFIGGIIGNTLKAHIYNCANQGDVVTYNSSDIGGIVGFFGALAIINDQNPNVIAKLDNCYNIGVVGGKGSCNVGGIAGESYARSSNSYNTGMISGKFLVGGIVGRGTLGDNNTPSYCYYLMGCTRMINPMYNDTPNKLGTVMSKKLMKSNVLKKKLNSWVQKHNVKKYSSWSQGSKNDGYPYLKLIIKIN